MPFRTRGNSDTARNFGKLILRKITEIVATKCHVLKLKGTKFDFGWGSAPHLTKELTVLSPTY